MPRSTLLRRGAALAAVLALAGAAGADASRDRGSDRGDRGGRDDSSRVFYATNDQNLLLQFNERNPERVRDIQTIRGLPDGTTLRGIDFRPATGDLYGVGSDNIVYRVNIQTGIAVAEGPAFTPPLTGKSFGVDFNPTVDKIRVTSDATENLRLNPDEGTTLMTDKNLNPGMPQVGGLRLHELVVHALRLSAHDHDAVRGRRRERPVVHPEPAERRHADDAQAAAVRRRSADRL